jgi:hypothetical protein
VGWVRVHGGSGASLAPSLVWTRAGITAAQRAALLALGAIEQRAPIGEPAAAC